MPDIITYPISIEYKIWDQRIDLGLCPEKITINCDATRFAVLDHTGLLTMSDFEKIIMTRNDVWDMVW